MKNLYVSAILNFQKDRGRPLEYYVTPINDFSIHQKDIVVFVDDKETYERLSPNITRVFVDYGEVSNFLFEESWRSMFLNYFKNDRIWYNLSRTYLLKPKLLNLARKLQQAERYTWIDAGMPCSHVFNHNFDSYYNIYTPNSISYIDDVMSKHCFLSQGWVCNNINGVDMTVAYDSLHLTPTGREHVTGCLFSLDTSCVDAFCRDFYETLVEFNNLKLPGTDESILAVTILKQTNDVATYPYQSFMTAIKSGW